MNTEALFFDPTEEYLCDGKLRFRTNAGDAQSVSCVFDTEEKKMGKMQSDAIFDYYETDAREGKVYFVIQGTDGTSAVYDVLGAHENTETGSGYEPVPFIIIPSFDTPSWSKGALMYQIFVDRFYNGDTSGDVKDEEYIYLGRPVKHKEWDELPETFDVANFHGGDLQGVLQKLDYLRSMGVEVIYFNPIFTSPSNHKYDTEDYRHVDPHFGGNSVFAELVREMHRRGMKVILDGVFNHCSERNIWMQIQEYFNYNRNGEYESWWDNITLPKLNYENSRELEDEVMDIAGMWLKEPYCIDGWRLDVAADLGHSPEYNHKFWKRFRREVKSVNPDAVIIAEHYGDASEWLKGDEWDTVMNYDGFMEPVSAFLTGMEKHSDTFDENAVGDGVRFMNTVRYMKSVMSMPSILSAMNELDNHDHSRFLTRTNRVAGRLGALGSKAAQDGTNICFLRQAQVLQMTMQGAPTIYYGDEAGLRGFTDPDSRRTYPWGNEDPECLEFCAGMTKLHNESRALRRGSMIWLKAERNVISFARTLGQEKYFVIIHTGDNEFDIDIPVRTAGITDEECLQGLVYTDCWNYGFTGGKVPVKDGIARIRIKPHGGYVLKNSAD
ncbi:MAG: alpha-amylase family glycosyl hydrolase [Lachnospiraceae bacterium]|nr:alpha-amylase family glycosyl hydrolase [Lachnospiraceae bacterium]